MSPIQIVIYLIFILPVMMIKTAWKMLTKKMTKEEKKEWLWRIPYVLIAILVILIIILWANGFQ